MKMGYFPGCSMGGSSREYGESLLAVAKALNLELTEIHDWNCCGASAAHTLNHTLALALPARNLGLAEKEGFQELVVPCAACFSRLASTRKTLLADEASRQKIAELVEMPLNQIPQSINILGLLQRLLPLDWAGRLVNPFNRPVACYYGCLLVRPAEIAQFDREENPQVMDQLMAKIGAKPVDWSFKTECCGAGFSIPRTDVVARLCSAIVEDAQRHGAEVIIVACPMCHSNLDMRRKNIEKYTGKKFSMPVLYITQAVGLALGLNAKALGLHRHIVPVRFPESQTVMSEKIPA